MPAFSVKCFLGLAVFNDGPSGTSILGWICIGDPPAELPTNSYSASICSYLAFEALRDMVTVSGARTKHGGNGMRSAGSLLKGILGLESVLLIRSTCVVFPRLELQHY
jgi:hypothetical protein